MNTRRMTPIEHVVVALLFGGLFAYFLFGVISGDLYLPGKRGPGIHLHGLAAWLVTLAPLSLYAGGLIRDGIFEFPRQFMQDAVEMIFLFGGLALLFAGSEMANHC